MIVCGRHAVVLSHLLGLVCQSGLVDPLLPPGPSLLVMCHHLGADGIPGLLSGAGVRVELRLGRVRTSLSATYTPKAVRDVSQIPPLCLPARSDSRSANVLTQGVHVYVFKEHQDRSVRNGTLIFLPT